MNKLNWIRGIALFLVFMGIIGYQKNPALIVEANAGAVNPDEVVTSLDKKKLADDDIKLDVPKNKAQINARDAVTAAQQAFPGLIDGSTDVKVEYHLVTNNSFQLFSQAALDKNPDLKSKKHMEKLPAYIVSFRGVSIHAHSPVDFKNTVQVRSEVNVVVDANTGEALMAFSHR